ncbi:hypothetical protein ACQQ2N_20215 [Dokdonella sp. MW10]|uniref:hypothetical protein n=1 Tax=Dokdonella sp. MW10 TaxID=2992926 RepID=UPI003F7EBEAF
MKMLHLAMMLAAGGLLVACSSGPVRRVSPPTASIQELVLQPGGEWKLIVRVQNFSNVPMTFSNLDAKLHITGKEVATVRSTVDLDIPGESADVFSLVVTPASGSKLDPGHDFAYELKGTIESRDPKGTFPFERTSRLSPVPGLSNTWR